MLDLVCWRYGIICFVLVDFLVTVNWGVVCNALWVLFSWLVVRVYVCWFVACGCLVI